MSAVIKLEDINYTYEDYKKWDGDWELIDGIPLAMAPSPMYGHQFVSLKISRQLDEQLEDCPECQVVFELDWCISEDSVVRPDSMVVCYEPEDFVTKKPEIIFEVASKSTIKKDETIKFNLYENEGVKYYIIVYPDMKKAKVYKLIDFEYKKIGDFGKETYNFELNKCDIEFDFSFIWRK